MAITHGYADLDTIKRYLDITGGSADAVLESRIEAASRSIDGWCDRIFYAITESRQVTADSSHLLVLVESIAAVTGIETDANGDRTYEVSWAATDFDLAPSPGPHTIIRTAPFGRYVFPLHRLGVRITGDWGYATVPDAIREACLLMTARLWKRKDAPFGIAGSADHGQLQTLPGMDPDVKQLIEPYRRFGLVV